MIMTVASYLWKWMLWMMLYEVLHLDILCLYVCWCSGGPPSVLTIGNLKGNVTCFVFEDNLLNY